MQELKETTAYRAALKERILDTAMKRFAEQGIRAVKMDDIASELGISKRTLYEIYKDKEELLFQGVSKHDQRQQAHLREFAESGHHVLDIVLEVYRMKVRETSSVNPAFYHDVLKYPRIERYILDNRKHAREGFIAFAQRGVQEGYFRPTVNYELMSGLFDVVEQYILEHHLMERHSTKDIFVSLFLIYLRGVCTEAGLKILDDFQF